MSKSLTESKIQEALEWAYDKAVNGVSGLDSAYELAQSYMSQDDSKYEQANSLIRWQNAKAASSGFLASALMLAASS